MSKILLLVMVTVGLFSCASKEKKEVVQAAAPTVQNRQIANFPDQPYDANSYAKVIICKFGITNAMAKGDGDLNMEVYQSGPKWKIIFNDCTGPMGGEYKVSFLQNRNFNLDFLASKTSDMTVAGAMGIVCVGKNTEGEYDLGKGIGLGLLVNVESKQFISTKNKSACFASTASLGMQGGVEILSPYSMKIEKQN